MKNGKIPDLDDGIENLWMCHDLTQCRSYFAIQSNKKLRSAMSVAHLLKMFSNFAVLSNQPHIDESVFI